MINLYRLYLNLKLTQRLNAVCQMAALIKNKIKAGDSTTYRNLLLYGPPGSESESYSGISTILSNGFL